MHQASMSESGRRVGSGYFSVLPSAREETAATPLFPFSCRIQPLVPGPFLRHRAWLFL